MATRRVRYVKFGSVVLEQKKCLACGELAYVTNDGRSSCCNAEMEDANLTGFRVEAQSGYKRKQPRKAAKRKILQKQNYQCYWCERDFGAIYIHERNKTLVKLKPTWDHYIPFVFTGNSTDDDFVASCQKCNQYKSSFMPYLRGKTNEEIEFYIRAHIDEKWMNNKLILAKKAPDDKALIY